VSEIRKAVLRFTRRSIGQALLAALTLGVLPQAAEAFHIPRIGGGGGGGGGGGSAITTFVLAGTQTSGVATQTFGMPFKDGDMPAGSAPVFKIGGTSQPYSYGLRSYFPSGNLRFVSIMLLPNVSISGSATVSVSAAVGSWPAASGRSLTDVYNQQLVVNAPPLALADPGGVANGALPGGGVQVSAWLYPSGDANIYKTVQWMDGGAGAAWRISTNMAASHGGTADTFLKFDHYIFALNNSSGGLAGFRWFGRMRMPNYAACTSGNNYFFCAPPNSGSPTSGLNWQINPGGAGIITNLPPWPFTPATDMTSTVKWSGTGSVSNGSGGMGNILNVTAITGTISVDDPVIGTGLGGDAYILSFVSGTGGTGTYTLGNIPGGGLLIGSEPISSGGVLGTSHGQTAWPTGGSGGNFVPVQFSGSVPSPWSVGYCYFGKISNSAPPGNFTAYNTTNLSPNSGQLPLTAETFTATPVVMIAPFTSFGFANTAAKYIYFQGTGSQSTDTALRMQINQTYWQSAKYGPPQDLTLSGAAFSGTIGDTTYNFNWNAYSFAGLSQNLTQGGDNDFIGAMKCQDWIDFYNQSALSEAQTRIIGLSWMLQNYDLKDPTLDTIVNVSGNSYTGLPASNLTIAWSAAPTSGFTSPGPGSGNVSSLGWGGTDTSHMPHFCFWPYIRTGELQYFDFLSEMSIAAFLGQPSRNPRTTSGDTPYNADGCITYQLTQMRATGWALRNVECAALLAPWNPTTPTVADFDGTQRSKYLNDLADTGAAFLIDTWNFLSAGSGVFSGYPLSASMWTIYNAGGSNPGYQNGPFWEMCYVGDACCYDVLRGSAAATKSLDFLNLLASRATYIFNTYGGWPLWHYQQAIGPADSGQTAQSWDGLITQDAEYVISQVSAIDGETVLSWAPNSGGSTNAFTFSNAPGNGYVPANGDVIIPDGINGAGLPFYPPELNTTGPFWIVNYTLGGGGNYAQFNLSTSKGGSAIAITSTGASNMIENFMPSNPPPASGGNVPNALNYMQQIQQCANWHTALGGTGWSAPRSDFNPRWFAATGQTTWEIRPNTNDVYNQNCDPRYCTVTAYAA
jgi:hypothetical protein